MATLKQKIQLLRGLIDGEIAYRGPFYVQVNPTNVCNMNCYGCRYHSSTVRSVSPTAGNMKYMPLELVETLCGQLPKLGTREVVICGEGESLLHPHWFEMVSAFKRAGLYVQLFTNGTLLDESTALRLLDSGLDVLNVSLWASSQEEYAACYPGTDPKHFQATLDGVKLVTSFKAKRENSAPTVILAGPLSRQNCRTIDKKIRLAHDLGCDGVAFAPFVDWTGEFASADVPIEEIDTVCEDLRRSKPLLQSLPLSHNLSDVLLRYRLGREVWRHVPCYAGWFYARLNLDGQVKPCGSCPTTFGNLYESSLEEIWNGQAYRSFREKGRTKEGLESLRQQCDCGWCCYARDSYKVYRGFRWFALLLGRTA